MNTSELEEENEKLRGHIYELVASGWKLLNELDTEAFRQVGPPNAELLYEHAGQFRQALSADPTQ